MPQTTYTGINIQWPISEMILSGKKTIETRTYPIPNKYLNREMILIETPGKLGKFKARIKGIIVFTSCFEYESKKVFYKDRSRHHVGPDSMWAWNEKPKWGWAVKVIKKINVPIDAPSKKGIVYTNNVKLPELS